MPPKLNYLFLFPENHIEIEKEQELLIKLGIRSCFDNKSNAHKEPTQKYVTNNNSENYVSSPRN